MKKSEIKKIISKFREILKEYRKPTGYYYRNWTNRVYWSGAKQGWKDCLAYLEMELKSLEEEIVSEFKNE